MSRQVNLGYQQLTVHTAASALTVPSRANLAVICSTTQNTRLRDDGTAPTASTGLPLLAGQPFTYDGQLDKVQLIAEAGTATVEILYYLAV